MACNRSLTSGSARTRAISLLIWLRIGRGVLAGASSTSIIAGTFDKSARLSVTLYQSSLTTSRPISHESLRLYARALHHLRPLDDLGADVSVELFG